MKTLTKTEIYPIIARMIKQTYEPDYLPLIHLLYDLCRVGHPPLMQACERLMRLKTFRALPYQTQLAISCVCSEVGGSPALIPERFTTPEYPLLITQLQALMADLELYLIPDPYTIDGLRWRLWIDACRGLLEEQEAEGDVQLTRALAELSSVLGAIVEVDIKRAISEGPSLMARHLGALERGGRLSRSVLKGGPLDALKERDVITLISKQEAKSYQWGELWSSAQQGALLRETAALLSMVYCPAGTFYMGDDDEHEVSKPRHLVTISEPFLISQTPITQRVWGTVMGQLDCKYIGDQRPVESVSWFEVAAFCNALSALEGLRPAYQISAGDRPDVGLDMTANGYRMPTEAEWEYAARAGTELRYAGSNEPKDVAWSGQYSSITRAVGLKAGNAWGLYDMSGNISEWCSDQYHPRAYQTRTEPCVDPYSYEPSPTWRVRRGGSVSGYQYDCRVYARNWGGPSTQWGSLGARLVRGQLHR